MEINELDSSAAEKYWNTVWASYTRSGHLALFDAPYGILPVLQKTCDHWPHVVPRGHICISQVC